MPTYPIQLRRNGTAAATPSSLLHGEVALNYADGKLFWKDASNVIQSFTFQAYALSSHSHGNITNAGAIGSTANLPVITTTSGVLTTGSFGTTATTFCEGNDSRLSDTRTPTDGSVTTAKLANDAVTYEKLQNVSATDRLLGRSSAGSGDVEEISCGSFGRSLIGSADAAAARSTLSVQPTASPAFTGTVVAAAASLTGAVTITRSTSTGAVADIPHIVFHNRNFTNATFVAGGVFSSTFRDVADPHYSAGMWFVRSPFSGNFSSSGDIVFGTGENVVQSAFPTERLRIAASGVSTFSGQLLVTAGSASACGVAFSGDPNTGMFSPGADQLAFSTNQTERLLIDANGVTTLTSSLNDGQLLVRNATANNTEKYGTFAGQHYTNAEEPALGMFVQSNATDNVVGIGGALGTFNAATQFRVYTAANNTTTTGTERLRVDANGNLLMAGSGSVASAASAAGAIHLKNGTAPTASITDGVVLFAADVSNLSELRVRDEAGNTTTLSPHAFPLIPDGPSEPMAWAYYSERDGRRINVDMLRAVRLLEQLTGEKLVYED